MKEFEVRLLRVLGEIRDRLPPPPDDRRDIPAAEPTRSQEETRIAALFLGRLYAASGQWKSTREIAGMAIWPGPPITVRALANYMMALEDETVRLLGTATAVRLERKTVHGSALWRVVEVA